MRIEPAPSNITRLSVLLVALIWANGGLGQTNVTNAPGNETLRTVTFRVKVPEGVGAVYMAGNRPEIGNWQPNGLALSGEGTDRTASLRLPAGTDLEYKFTLGSWEREALGPTGTIPQNHRLRVDSDQEITIEITAFRKQLSDYLADWKGGGILGRLEYWRDVSSKHLTATRHVGIWLPPGYDDNPAQRYNVLYMHDGQNLFDPRIASTGVDWGVDEAVVRNVEADRMPPLIVVSVWCTSQRAREYSPWDLGTNYARFLIEELIPRVDGKFRTLTGPEHTGVMGSSMGGLISFWLCWKYPRNFGRAGCVSTHFPWTGRFGEGGSSERPLIERDIAAGASIPNGLRFYFDYGTKGIDSTYEPVHDKVKAWLVSQGLKEPENFVMKKFEGADHNEAAWRARLDEPLRFLFGRPTR